METFGQVEALDQKIDIIVGIPSYNEADNISFVTKQVDEGISKYFPHLKGLVVNVDNNSPDGTKKEFLNTFTKNPKLYATTLEGVSGKGNNFYNLFQIAQKVQATVIIVVDADLLSITPEWVKHLGSPVEQGYDFVTPLYSRHKYDGTITNNIVYPLIYGLTGMNVRQPIGGDFAFSLKMVDHWLKQEWTDTTRRYGVDNFMTTHAIFGGFKCCNTVLGSKIHKPSAPKLGEMFIQVVGTLFDTIVKNREVWENRDTLQELPVFGAKDITPPQDLIVDPVPMKNQALKHYQENREYLATILNPNTFRSVDQTFASRQVRLDARLWAELVYEFLASYSKENDKRKLVESMKPLYFGRVVSFIKETSDKESLEAEQDIVEQAMIFRKMKKRLTAQISRKRYPPVVTIVDKKQAGEIPWKSYRVEVSTIPSEIE